MRRIALFILLPLFAVSPTARTSLFAQDQLEGGSASTSSSEIAVQITSSPGAKLGFTRRYSFPVLQGENPLMANNNIGLALCAELSPASINVNAEFALTPIAFFQFSAGGRIGTGWNINFFRNDIYGIGLNYPDVVGKAVNDGSAFDGILWGIRAGGALQFDAAAIFPGDWHHLVARSYHEINLKGYTRADAGESWYYENDDGENINGFNYYGNALLGYQMPIFFNMVALLAETDLYLYNTPLRSMWGDDLLRWTFSSIFSFAFDGKVDLALIAQFRTRRNYQEADWQDLYYRNRNLDTQNPMHLEFYRVVASVTLKL